MVPPWPYFGHGEHTQCMCGTEAFPSTLGSVRRRSGCVRACVHETWWNRGLGLASLLLWTWEKAGEAHQRCW